MFGVVDDHMRGRRDGLAQPGVALALCACAFDERRFGSARRDDDALGGAEVALGVEAHVYAVRPGEPYANRARSRKVVSTPTIPPPTKETIDTP